MVVKSTSYSRRGPRVCFQHLHGGPQLPGTSVLGDLRSSDFLRHQAGMWCTNMRGKTFVHIQENIFKEAWRVNVRLLTDLHPSPIHFLPRCPSTHPPTHSSKRLLTHLSIHTPLHQPAHSPMHLFTSTSIRPPIFLPTHVPIHPSTYPPIYLVTCPPIFSSTPGNRRSRTPPFISSTLVSEGSQRSGSLEAEAAGRERSLGDPLEGLWSTLAGKSGRFAEGAAAAAQIRISRLIIERPGPPGFLDKPGSVFGSQFDSFCPRAGDSKAPEAE